MVNNVCQRNSFCANSHNICYSPSNLWVSSPDSNDGMRDCSSLKKDEIEFYSYLSSAYSLC